MNTISVRKAAEADIKELAVLFDEYRQFQQQSSDLLAAHAFLLERFNRAESVLFACYEDDAPSGFAQLYPSFSSVSLSPVFILNDLFVKKSSRGKGIATLLLSEIELFAWSLGVSRITLNVAVQNYSARALYEHRGWKQDDQYFMYHCFPKGS